MCIQNLDKVSILLLREKIQGTSRRATEPYVVVLDKNCGLTQWGYHQFAPQEIGAKGVMTILPQELAAIFCLIRSKRTQNTRG
jgi:hypothetical protein